MVLNRIGCPRKAKEQLGFHHEISLRVGLQKLIDWRNSNN